MTTIAIDPEVFDGLSDEQEAALRATLGVPHLGEPAIWEDGEGKTWFVFDDPRINPDSLEALAEVVGDPTLLVLPEEGSDGD